MSASTIERLSSAIATAARTLDLAVTRVGALRWSLAVPAWPCTVSARLDGDWLVLESALPAAREAPAPWELLRWNSLLAGPGKFALTPEGRVAIRAELPADDPDVLPHRLRGWCADLASAALFLCGRAEVVPSTPPDAIGTAHEGASVRELLGPMCEAAGWSFTERSASQLRVVLDLPEGYLQACVDVHADGTLCAAVELARFDRLGRLGRHALAGLLLQASGLVRLARAAVVAVGADGGEEATVRFEVRLTRPLGTGELHHALSALATAVRLCGREVEALRDETLARTYLSVREPGSSGIRLTDVTPHQNQEAMHATE